MAMTKLDVALDEAMAHIRAYAREQRRSLGEVAHEIVGRRLTLADDKGSA